MIPPTRVQLPEPLVRTLQSELEVACGRTVRLTREGHIHPEEAMFLNARLAPFGCRVDETSDLACRDAVLRLIPLEPVLEGSDKDMAELTAEARAAIVEHVKQTPRLHELPGPFNRCGPDWMWRVVGYAPDGRAAVEVVRYLLVEVSNV